MHVPAQSVRSCGAGRQDGGGIPADAELEGKGIADDELCTITREAWDAVGGCGEDVCVFVLEVGGGVEDDV